jgi:hypothetical protein
MDRPPFFRIAFILLILGGVLLAVPYLFPHDRPLEVTISTKPLAVLPEHSHDLGEAEGDDGHGVYAYSESVVVPEDMWVTTIEAHMKNAPDSTIHHFILKEMGATDPACPNSSGRTLFLFGRDTRSPQHFGAAPYGIFIPKGTPLALVAMIHNPHPPEGVGGTYKDVSAVMTVRGVASGGSRTKPLSIRFLVLSDTSYCNDSPEANTFSIPALRKEYVQQSTTLQGINRGSLTFDGDATLLGFGGHIHAWEGGNALAVYLNNNLLQLITPHQAGAEPWSWKTAPVDRAVPMKKGDTISLTATYENPNVVPTRGAMGIVGLIFWQPSKEAELLAPYKQTTATTTLDRYGTF